MTTKRWLSLLVLGVLTASSARAINMELSRLVDEDQADRRSMQSQAEWLTIAARDHQRRLTVLQMSRARGG